MQKQNYNIAHLPNSLKSCKSHKNLCLVIFRSWILAFGNMHLQFKIKQNKIITSSINLVWTQSNLLIVKPNKNQKGVAAKYKENLCRLQRELKL